MQLPLLIMTLVLVITLISPLIVYKGIQFAKDKNYPKHRKIQNIIFLICIVGLIGFEGLLNALGGSGSIAAQSSYAGSSLFKAILAAHIIGAILTYLLWFILIIYSNIVYKKSLPGKSGKTHKYIGIIVYIGLIYTAATALPVYIMTLI